jgi:hypothetical protein
MVEPAFVAVPKVLALRPQVLELYLHCRPGVGVDQIDQTVQAYDVGFP